MGLNQSNSRTPSRDPLPNPPDHQVMDVYEPGTPSKRGRKRRTRDVAGVESKKVAKLNTCAYVYEKLFLQGEESDITLIALDREWKVHKLYLKQAKFFERMFDGKWAESNSGKIPMEITDPNINAEGLNSVLGSLYHNEIEIDLEKVEGIVAAASYLDLQSVSDRCAEMMISAMNTTNAIRFHDLSNKYGLQTVQEQSMQLILHNFWKIMTNKQMLKEIDIELLMDILTSPDLLIVEGEFDLYKAVKLWIYLRENPLCNLDEPQDMFSHKASVFFKSFESEAIFMKYHKVFSRLRFEQFLTCSETIKAVKMDKIIPCSIIDEMTSALWVALLENEECPRALDLDNDMFFSRCIRLGRSLDSFPKCWRWIGFNFGVDLLLHVNDYSVCIKRNCLNQKAPYSVNLKSKHTLHYRLVICDPEGRIVHDSGKQKWVMSPDEAKTLYRISEDTGVPISIHFQYLIHPPVASTESFVNKYIKEKTDELYDEDDDDEEEEEEEEEQPGRNELAKQEVVESDYF